MPDDDGISGEFRDWHPSPSAVELQRFDAEGRSSRIVRHIGSPFVADVGAVDDAVLQDVVNQYLRSLQGVLRPADRDSLALPSGWARALESMDKDELYPRMRWLEVWPRLRPAEAEVERPRLASWNLTRNHAPDSPLEDGGKAVVMVATETVPVTGRRTRTYGLCVPVSITPDGADGHVLQIRSMTIEVPLSPYRSFTEVEDDLADAARLGSEIDALADVAEESIGEIAERLQLDPDLSFEDFRPRWSDVDGQPTFDGGDLTGMARGALSRRPAAESYGFLVRFGRREGGGFAIVAAQKHVLSSHASSPGLAEVFRQDPASGHPTKAGVSAHEHQWTRRRPTRSERTLQCYRVKEEIGSTEVVALEETDFRVRNCPAYVRNDPSSSAAKTVRLPPDTWPEVRRDAFSAISAFYNCRRFFKMIEDFGIDYESLTPMAEREVQVFYRSGMTRGPGRNGQTVNARVSLVHQGNDALPVIEVHLALGNLSHRGRWPGGATAARWAEPLGIATSPRWMWHEFAHVLIGAKFGKLEFGFAHSVGDGLAAVMADPFSRLAGPRTGLGLRKYTFPWVFATRRHDRSVRLGWAWNGSLNQRLLGAPLAQRLGFKGYVSEQILSTTLFRLYRILGGDSVGPDDRPNLALRERASLLVQFLVIEAIRSLSINPREAEDFELAMENADTLMSGLDFGAVSELDPPAGTQADIWRAGQAHKVVRWAFEAQGMFAPPDQGYLNAPGLPPRFDVYIADNRPNDELTGGGTISYRPGGYVPVSLDWNQAPRWHGTHALPSAGETLRLTVGNRGRFPATNLKLRAWVGSLTGNPSNPSWDLGNRVTWKFPVGPIEPGDTLQPGQVTEFQIGLLPGQAIPPRPILLFEVSCAGDPANSDPVAGFPCAITDMPPRIPRHLADLVANDNNLALCRP